MPYVTPDYRLNPPEDRVYEQRVRMQERSLIEGREVAREALKNARRDAIAAVAFVTFEWSDPTIVDPTYEAMVRKVAQETLLESCSAADAVLWHALLEEDGASTAAEALDFRELRGADLANAILNGIREGQREGLAV